jgi:transcription initiation factor IIE alpha subunit
MTEQDYLNELAERRREEKARALKKLTDLHDEGLSDTVIAVRLGVSVKHVGRLLERLGLKRRGP